MRAALFVVVGVLLFPLITVWVPVSLSWRLLSGMVLRAWFRRAHGARGRTMLFVYSNSPNWQSYVEANTLPRLADRAVVLNWSERAKWSSSSPWEGRFFRRFAGPTDFNPAALVYRPDGRVEVIRFYRAFLDLKHGDPFALHEAETALSEHLASP
jgi:hypothetical protein